MTGAAASTTGVAFREATPENTDRIIEIMHGEPMAEAVGLCFGDKNLAFALGAAMVRLPNSPSGWQRTVLAVQEGNPVGVLQAGPQDVGLGEFITPVVILKVLRIFGPLRFVRGLPRIRARSRVEFDAVPGAYGVHELHVDPAHRNRGIGQAMLSHAEAEARRLGHPRMSLTTTTSNPARRLYERNGYRVAETKTDPAYERYTGIKGRYLMVKELS